MNTKINAKSFYKPLHKPFYLCASIGIALSLSACHSSTSQEQVAEDVKQVKQTETEQFELIDVQASTAKVRMPLARSAIQVVRDPIRLNTENYQKYEENKVFQTATTPLSTFSIDVDTGSYSNIRRMLNQGTLPPADAVRVEEFINYFSYNYGSNDNLSSAQLEHPFIVNSAVSESPWHEGRLLMRVGIQAKEIQQLISENSEDQHISQPKNLTFLLDVSGSMNSPNKLPLVKKALTLLTRQLTEQDKISIVVYAGASGVVLEPTAATNRVAIEQALDKLNAGGSTNGGEGIELAYKLAQQSFVKHGINRVILATDGDFNVGQVNQEQLIELIEKQKNNGVQLTTLGFGQGNYNDALMEQLADKGDGNYAYIDTLSEARKVLVRQLDATLNTVAKDVKIQIEFNPAQIEEYRLIGYENRVLNKEDFNNDKVDAGEIGVGHTVTAFYELTPKGGSRYTDKLRYASASSEFAGKTNNELAFVKLRYKPITEDKSEQPSILFTTKVEKTDISEYAQQSNDFKFATAVVSFAQKLKNSNYADGQSWQDIVQLGNANKGKDEYGYRAEFVSLVRMASVLNED